MSNARIHWTYWRIRWTDLPLLMTCDGPNFARASLWYMYSLNPPYLADPSCAMRMLRVIFVSILTSPAAALLVGASVLPHGDFSLLPSLLPDHSTNRTLAEALHTAAFAATAVTAAAAPDVIVLIAPHAIALSVDFAVYTATNASGTAWIGGDLHNPATQLVPFTVAVRGAPDMAANLVDDLGTQASNVSALLPWGDSEPAPLRWSEVVPLTFLGALTNTTLQPPPPASPPLLRGGGPGRAQRPALRHSPSTERHASPAGTPGVVVWSQPLRRYDCAECM